MTRWQEVGRLVDRVFKPFRKSRRTTIADLTKGLLRRQRIGLANVARGMHDGTTIKHRVKRVGRFLSNDAVDVWLAAACLVRYLFRSDVMNVVAVDWTDMGGYMLLKASLVFRKRALPIAWRHVWKWHYEKSQNDEENMLIAKLGEVIGDRPWVLVADRGFGRAELFRLLDERGIRYVIRVSGCAWVEHQWFTGPIDHIPRRPGRGYRYAGVLYRKNSPVRLNLVVKHREPAPAPWYLVTNLDARAEQIARYYAQRMAIEQCIRDCKSGLGLKDLVLCEPERMDRAVLLLAVAILIIALTATACLFDGRTLRLSTQRRRGTTLSFFTLGLRILEQYPHLLSTKRRTLYAV